MTHATALAAYHSVETAAEVDSARPERLIQMLLDGALNRIYTAKGDLQRGEIASKGSQIGKAISIVDGLRVSLNPEAGAISQNLEDLYDYIARRLFEANVTNDTEILDETAALLHEIKSAWDVLVETAADQPGDSQ